MYLGSSGSMFLQWGQGVWFKEWKRRGQETGADNRWIIMWKSRKERDSSCVPLHIHRQTSNDLYNTGWALSDQYKVSASGLKKKDGEEPQPPNIQSAAIKKMGWIWFGIISVARLGPIDSSYRKIPFCPNVPTLPLHPVCSLNRMSMLPPLGLCTHCSLCLKCFSCTPFLGWFLLTSAQRPPPQRGCPRLPDLNCPPSPMCQAISSLISFIAFLESAIPLISLVNYLCLPSRM